MMSGEGIAAIILASGTVLLQISTLFKQNKQEKRSVENSEKLDIQGRALDVNTALTQKTAQKVDDNTALTKDTAAKVDEVHTSIVEATGTHPALTRE